MIKNGAYKPFSAALYVPSIHPFAEHGLHGVLLPDTLCRGPQGMRARFGTEHLNTWKGQLITSFDILEKLLSVLFVISI